VQYYQRELCGELEKPDAYLEDPQALKTTFGLVCLIIYLVSKFLGMLAFF